MFKLMNGLSKTLERRIDTSHIKYSFNEKTDETTYKLILDIKVKDNIKENCKYCDEDRIINQSAILFMSEGSIICLNNNNELVINKKGEQGNIPIKFCPWCGNKLKE